MNPTDRELLERALELSLENNRILRKMQRAARWALVWGFVKFLIIIVPLVIGFILLQPYFEPLQEAYESLKPLLVR